MLGRNSSHYNKSIVRILNGKDRAVGTGFLIAPGYVLTCAHVVLQSLDIDRKKFADYLEAPTQVVKLDFPVYADVRKLEAEVADWVPYDISKGDIAVLKLMTPEPEDAVPLSITKVESADIEGERHLVYGFGDEYGGCSEAYTAKTTVYGGRLQFQKIDDPNDETIEEGYSGAPVWNEHRGVVGMIATVAVGREALRNKAYAIPREVLAAEKVLQKVSALSLRDVLLQEMNSCCDEAEKNSLEIAVTDALRLCNPNADLMGAEGNLTNIQAAEVWKQQLCTLATDLPPEAGWDVEGRLVRFVVKLSFGLADRRISEHTYDALKVWVKQQGFNFAVLFERAKFEASQCPPAGTSQCKLLMVSVEQVGASTERVRVSIWPVADRNTYTLRRPPESIVQKKEMPISEVPTFIREQRRKRLANQSPTVHLFAPFNIFERNLEMWPCDRRGRGLGCQYPLVLRINLNAAPWVDLDYFFESQYYADWSKKWMLLEQALQSSTADVLVPVNYDDIDWDDLVENISAARLENCSDVEDFFAQVADETALPIALWARDAALESQLGDVLDGTLEQLGERIRQERESAQSAEDDGLLGHNLSLLWEDPKIIPPDIIPFDPT